MDGTARSKNLELAQRGQTKQQRKKRIISDQSFSSVASVAKPLGLLRADWWSLIHDDRFILQCLETLANLDTEQMEPFGRTLITALDNFFGRRVTAQDLLRAVAEKGVFDPHDGRLYNRQFKFWASLWEVLEPLSELGAEPDADFAEVFSIIPHWAAGTERLRRADDSFDGEKECEDAVDSIKSYLLYYPRVLVGYFLTYEVEQIEKLSWNERNDRLEDSPFFLPPFLRSFAPIIAVRELVENGVVIVTPRFDRNAAERNAKRDNNAADILLTRLREEHALDQNTVFALSDWFFRGGKPKLGPTDPDWEQFTRYLLRRFEREVASVERLGANYVANNEAFWKLLQTRFRSHGVADLENDKIDRYLAVTLRHMRLPALKSLSPRDIIELRLNDEHFEEWRSGIRTVLRYFGDRGIGGDFEREFRRVVADVLRPSAASLIRAARTSSLSHVSTNAFVKFALSAVVAQSSAWLFGLPEVAVMTPSAVALAHGTWEIGKAYRSRKDAALLRHYSLLCQPKSGNGQSPK